MPPRYQLEISQPRHVKTNFLLTTHVIRGARDHVIQIPVTCITSELQSHVQDFSQSRKSTTVVVAPLLSDARIVDRGAEEVLRVYEKTREDVAAIAWAG